MNDFLYLELLAEEYCREKTAIAKRNNILKKKKTSFFFKK